MKTAKTKPPKSASASALIIAVILTSLLAIIGMMFVMIARVDKMATSAISENKQLNFAAEAVVAKISRVLVSDVPGVAGQEYYDYPDACNAWLANLEPYQSGSDYYWRRISDIYGKLDANNLKAIIIPDYQSPSDIGDNNIADADGDGVADSKWVKLADMTSNKGKPIYAAVRVVDNGAMINVNTAYKFDPNKTDANQIDGSSQMQINIEALAKVSDTIGQLNEARGLSAAPSNVELSAYKDGLIWRIEDPCKNYLPFDISDEVELRNRGFIDSPAFTRLEGIWTKTFVPGYPTSQLRTPYDRPSDLPAWFTKASDGSSGNYTRRHICTTYNMDRIIDPNGGKMLNINDANVSSVYNAIIDANLNITRDVAAQIAVNLKDYADSDSYVSTIDVNGNTYYGFEQPCIYISELAEIFKQGVPPDTNIYRSYAVELYKPYSVDSDPCNWQLVIDGTSFISIDWSVGSKHFCVIRFEDPNTPAALSPPLLTVTFAPDPGYDHIPVEPGYNAHFNAGSTISLQRQVTIGFDDVNGENINADIEVDSITVPAAAGNWWADDGIAHSIQRDIALPKCIRRLWAKTTEVSSPDLGGYNIGYSSSDSNVIQAHPENKPFTNIGEIGMILRKSAYTEGPNPIDKSDTEVTARLNLADPCYQNLFQYLTVFDPNNFLPGEPNETRIKGRININTAPWYVLAQLPWVSQRKGSTDYSLAQAIVKYRDVDKTPKGFESIGELIDVPGMDYYKTTQSGDLTTFPDLIPGGDGVPDDFKERDIIFARISNLVTVRSDVFTAYILVRIGKDGPQKRVMAILDRSGVRSPADKVRIIALHPVPDPR